MRFSIGLLLLSLCCANGAHHSVSLRHVEVFVGPSGAESNGGSSSAPLNSLEAARDRLRALGGVGHTITLLPGTYLRSAAFQIDARDAGLTLQGRPGARLIGGQILTGFVPVSHRAMLAKFAEEARPHIIQLDLRKLGIAEFGELKSRGFGRPTIPSHCELFFGARPMTLARWPNEGDWERIAGYPTNSATRDSGDQAIGRLEEGFFYQGDRPRRWSGRDDIWVHGYWAYDWANSYERVASIDVEKRLIKTAPPHGLYGFRKNQRFYFLNMPEGLDQPGEWYLDRATGTVYFWPPGPLGSSEVLLSLLDQPLVRMTNATGVTVRGIQFEAARGNAIEIAGGASNRVSGCRIRNIGNWAVRVTGGTNHAVVSCDIFDTGDGGVCLTGGDRQTLTSGGHSVENCHFQRQGRWSKCYVPAVTMEGVGLRASHNLIHDQPHCAILFWGNDHLIEFNDIHHVAMETGDVGAIYTGRDYTFRGNRIRHNFIHETGGVGMGSMGVYMDDCVSGTEVFGNVFYKAHWAMFIGGGRDHRVENNLFVDCDPAVRADGRGIDPHPVWRGQVDTTLRQRLAEVPAELYRARYPALQSLDRFYGPPGGPPRVGNDFPGVPPEDSVIARNVCLGKWMEVAWFADRTMFDVRNNDVLSQTNRPATVVEGLRRMKDASARTLGIVPIPFERIGLRRDAERKSLENLQ
jgi:hypothetical protein